MKKLMLSAFVLITLIQITYCQVIPDSALYLGQTPPRNTPKIFPLPVTSGYFAAERIAISHDGKEIYYSETNGYSPTSKGSIKFMKYTDGKWNGPITLFDSTGCPAISNGEKYLFANGLVSIKTDTGWSVPSWFMNRPHKFHYLQDTYSGTLYVAAKDAKNSIGKYDWSKIVINHSDTIIQSLGSPVNKVRNNMDFYISRKESYIILASNGLQISYHKIDGSWTNPKNLGSTINNFLGIWGPYVTDDDKFLFFSAGTKQDYSDTYVRWIRIDKLIDSLKHTNFEPWLKSPIPSQTDSLGYSFTYTIPDSTYIDDDGNNTLTYTAALDNGTSLPTWLSFNSNTRTFSGTPSETGEYTIKISATDTAKASASCTFTIKVIKTNKY